MAVQLLLPGDSGRVSVRCRSRFGRRGGASRSPSRWRASVAVCSSAGRLSASPVETAAVRAGPLFVRGRHLRPRGSLNCPRSTAAILPLLYKTIQNNDANKSIHIQGKDTYVYGNNSKSICICIFVRGGGGLAKGEGRNRDFQNLKTD